MLLTIIHNNPVRVDGDAIWVDRKFHVGMQAYLERIDAPILSVHPAARPEERTLDAVRVPRAELGYEILTLALDEARNPLPADALALEERIAASSLVYGYGYGSSALARRRRVPYILILEYDLGTQMVVANSHVTNPLRRLVRIARTAGSYYATMRPAMQHALAVHCNGYPIFDAAQAVNPNRVLYLDSRMSQPLVIGEQALAERLRQRAGRPLRLLYSGRYEPMKGAEHAVRVAAQSLAMGLDVEMHCYGQGPLKASMLEIAAASVRPDRIHVHDTVPYPELVELSRGFDVFVCCHVQSDPSCTYLESFGAGLPIVGYDNRMWRRLCEISGAGRSSPLGDPHAVAANVRALAQQPAVFDELSQRARSFALQHTFEREFDKRTEALNQALRNTAAR